MVKTALVATELALGPKILEALDSAELSISVAMWLYPEEYEDFGGLFLHPGDLMRQVSEKHTD